ncbi:MAG: hypothetical protein LBO75_05355, partial [Bifidobacteriaceae bacterium]|nr:hypothetical protein [Bifidobacteriaceae bacterium]
MLERIPAIIPQGLSFLGSAITKDPLGAGAALLTMVRGDASKEWRAKLTLLANKGWGNAAKLRIELHPSFPEPARQPSVEYLLRCLNNGELPTASGLMSYP